jgi:phenylalanyl-tRNA synthetase beta chain
MKFTINWLKRHLDTSASAAEICAKLTAIGLEVESFEDKAAAFAPFKVAYVEKAEKHPDADKLQICTVKTETGTIQVVCGAPNARTGMKAIFAPDGTYIPGLDVTLKKTKIRGVESNGMLVSEREMQLSDEHNGIIEVADTFEIGTPLSEIYGLNEQLIEINLTPNRADCTGVRGVARDLAAAGLGTLKPQDESPVKSTFKSAISVKIEDTEGCPLFLGRTIKNIKNAPSPKWLQDMLKSIGLRPISALVDITNLMTMDQARPLHVFDADKIKGDIIVRTSRDGESFDALNDKSYTLQAGAIAITDDNGLLGLGGIVGGASTGCTDETVNVFLEAAYFTPLRIARTGRFYDVQSDARYRFERGIDPAFTFAGIEMATRLILEICGTDKSEVSEIVQAGQCPPVKEPISFNPSYTEKLGGIIVEKTQQISILRDLGFDVQDNGSTLTVQQPSWRGDIEGKADLVEEITRIFGYDNITPVSVRNEKTFTAAAETQTLMRARTARAAMTVRGMDECVTWSFMSKNLAAQFGSNDNPALALSNPISADLDQMRPSILPNLIEAARRNTDRGFANISLCEVGPIFQSSKIDGQQYMASGIRAGQFTPRHWATDQALRPVDAYDAKADAMAVLAACGAPAENAQISRDAPSYYHPGRSGALRLGKSVLAYFGEIHPALLEDMDVKGNIVGFEVFLQNIPAPRKKDSTAKPLLTLSPFQPLKRDFAFIVKDTTASDDVLKAAKAADKSLITDAVIFDIYTGKGVDEGFKSLALTITIQPTQATLTDEQIDNLMNAVINAVAEKTGGKLRS